jgi:hypothetical protein
MENFPMAATSQYEPTNSPQDVMTRLDQLETTVNRILRLQRLDIDDFTINGMALGSMVSQGCSSNSRGCVIKVPPPRD